MLAASVGAQDNPMDDPDLQQLLKQAQEMQKTPNRRIPGKKLADMEAMAKAASGATGAGGRTRKGRIADGAKTAA